MLRVVRRVYSRGGPRVTLYMACGHFTRRNRHPGRLWSKVNCGLCAFTNKERETKDEKRAIKKAKREKRKLRQQRKVEKLIMVKKKMASKKVVKKSALKGKGKTAKGAKMKVGRKWFLCPFLYAEEKSVLARIIAEFNKHDDKIVGENEIIAALEKAGVKDDGKKTVKKQVKAALRNMLRAGAIVKQRDLKRIGDYFETEKDEDEDADEEEEDEDDDASEEDEADGDDDSDSDGDEDSDDEDIADADESDDEEEEEEDEDDKPVKTKKKKPASKKTKSKKSKPKAKKTKTARGKRAKKR